MKLEIETAENGYILNQNGVVKYVFNSLPSLLIYLNAFIQGHYKKGEEDGTNAQ